MPEGDQSAIHTVGAQTALLEQGSELERKEEEDEQEGEGLGGIYSTRSCWDQGLTRCCRTLSVELNMVEPLLMSAEYWRLEMVKLSVRVSRLCNRAARRGGERWQSLRPGLSP